MATTSGADEQRWVRFLDERFGETRGVAGNWLVYEPNIERPGEWRALEREPFRPWASATIKLDWNERRIIVTAWHRGLPLSTFTERTRIDGAIPLEVLRAIHHASVRADITSLFPRFARIDADGTLFIGTDHSVAASKDGSAQLLTSARLLVAGKEAGPAAYLSALMHANFPEECRADDDAREDLSALPIDVVERRWRTVDVPVPDFDVPRGTRVNLAPPVPPGGFWAKAKRALFG